MWYSSMFILMIMINVISAYFFDIRFNICVAGELFFIFGYISGGIFKSKDILDKIKGDK